MTKNVIKWLVLGACSLLFMACHQSPPAQISLHGKTMGTTYHIKLVSRDDGVNEKQLQNKIDGALLDVNKAMSTYMPDSELSRLNQAPAEQLFPLSAANYNVIAEAIRLNKLSDGALDITVGPLVNLWGFGPKSRPTHIPSDDLIEATKAKTGLDKLTLTDKGIIKHIADLYIDLSSIAKGYGVDVIAGLLESEGIHDYLVEVGGEMRLSGHKANGSEWRVAIEKPRSVDRAIEQIISVGNNSIATSGDYRNYYEENGVRYSHTIDPTTGRPITHNLASVTIVNPSCMTADGLATAMDVMGFDKAKAFALKQQLAVMLIRRGKDGFKVYHTPQFEPFLR